MTTSHEKKVLKQKLTTFLRGKEDIMFAYLFGSTARMEDNKKSDIDIAVYLTKDTIQHSPLYPESLSLSLEKKIKRPIDIRVLNNQNLRFLHQVLKDGELLFSKNNTQRVLFETDVYDRYLDFKYFIDQYNRLRRERLSS